MEIREIHPFDLTPNEAARLQEELRTRVRTSGEIGEVSLVAGADASYTKTQTRFMRSSSPSAARTLPSSSGSPPP